MNVKFPPSERLYSLDGSPQDRSVVGAIAVNGGIWEPHIISVMTARIAPDDVCFDIGANIGIFAILMGSLAHKGHVYAFEPASENIAFLKQNLIRNQISNVSPVHGALWNQARELKLFYMDELAGCGFLESGSVQDALTKIRSVVTQPWLDEIELNYHTECVTCLRLDDFVREAGLERLGFIKLDAEGAEPAVLEGARETISRYQPQLVAEFNPACLTKYFGHNAYDYLQLIEHLYPKVFLIESSGDLTAVPDYEWLAQRIAIGKGWEDLFCSF